MSRQKRSRSISKFSQLKQTLVQIQDQKQAQSFNIKLNRMFGTSLSGLTLKTIQEHKGLTKDRAKTYGEKLLTTRIQSLKPQSKQPVTIIEEIDIITIPVQRPNYKLASDSDSESDSSPDSSSDSGSASDSD